MLEITSPDALGTVRIVIDGIERYTVSRRVCKVAEGVEFVVAPADLSMCGIRYFSTEGPALMFAASRAMDYYGG